MRKTWATLGLDLHLDLGATRVRAGLEAALRQAASGGRLRPGTRLPSSRVLALDLGLARNTVADAYGQLVAEGWLTTRPGGGTWVAEAARPRTMSDVPAAAMGRTPAFDLRPGVPDLTSFPRSAWLAAQRRALASSSAELLGYSHVAGLPPLREALADYTSRARGVAVTPDRVVICAGFAQGLDLVCKALRARGGRSVTIEAHGYRGHQRIIESAGLNAPLVPVDPGGAAVDQLVRTKTDALLLTPAHQFPVGVPLEPARRRWAAAWAIETGSLIIEDDYDGEFRYDRQPLGAMQALAPEHIVYAGTASKNLAPGLRMGWLVLPGSLVGEVVAQKAAMGAMSSALDQLALAEFITSGALDRQIRRMRLIYRRRRERLAAALGREGLHLRLTGAAAGLHALLALNRGQKEGEIVRLAAERSLAIEGLSSYARGSLPAPPALVVGYGSPPEHAFSSAVARLCAVLEIGNVRVSGAS